MSRTFAGADQEGTILRDLRVFEIDDWPGVPVAHEWCRCRHLVLRPVQSATRATLCDEASVRDTRT